jgi:hypothetical protein
MAQGVGQRACVLTRVLWRWGWMQHTLSQLCAVGAGACRTALSACRHKKEHAVLLSASLVRGQGSGCLREVSDAVQLVGPTCRLQGGPRLPQAVSLNAS